MTTTPTPLTAFYVDPLRRFVRAFDLHLAKCAAGRPSIPPSKGRKGNAYSAASVIARQLGMTSPQTYADLKAILAAVQA